MREGTVTATLLSQKVFRIPSRTLSSIDYSFYPVSSVLFLSRTIFKVSIFDSRDTFQIGICG